MTEEEQEQKKSQKMNLERSWKKIQKSNGWWSPWDENMAHKEKNWGSLTISNPLLKERLAIIAGLFPFCEEARKEEHEYESSKPSREWLMKHRFILSKETYALDSARRPTVGESVKALLILIWQSLTHDTKSLQPRKLGWGDGHRSAHDLGVLWCWWLR